jgi:uncharacterized FAD-dependent dehydrogenase
MIAMATNGRVDVLVLGAGPAGLAAGCAAADAGAEVLVLEGGLAAEVRNRDRPADLAQGVGGAGLYSDGKFSFAPSATALWLLKPRDLLQDAYAWTTRLLGEFGVLAPPFLEGPAPETAGHVKAYPSQYMSPQDRAALVSRLAGRLGGRLRPNASATLIGAADGVMVALADGVPIEATAAVLAGGRFGPLLESAAPVRFRRVELGVRVETPADRFPLDGRPDLLDPKWIRDASDGRVQWRTFCCCRRGEVVETDVAGLRTVSGRADGPPTEVSNVGFNVRLLESKRAEQALAQAIATAHAEPPSVAAVCELLAGAGDGEIARRLGTDTASTLADGLRLLQHDFGPLPTETKLHLPAIEGVAYYPRVDSSLRVGSRLWAAGDATGMFRGIVPALVSGRFAGAQAAARV